jgi:hypothetical protein
MVGGASRRLSAVPAGQWLVEAREGGPDGTSRTWESASETDARTMVERCVAAADDGWRETTDAYRIQQEMRK